MARGVKTKPEIVEKAIQLFAIEGSYSEVGRQLGIARQTTSDLIENNIEFSEFRQQVEQHYIVEAWSTVTATHKALHALISDPEYISTLSALDLTMVIEKLHRTVTNVANHIMAIQVKIGGDSDEDVESAAFEYVASRCDKSVSQVKELLNID